MNIRGARIIVVTKDSLFFTHIKSLLSADDGISLVMSVSTIADAENKFSDDKRNIMLVDADSSGIGDALQVRRLSQKKGLYILFTGLNQMKAAPYATASTPVDFFAKSINYSAFVNGVLVKIRPFLFQGETRPPQLRDVKDIADLNSKVVFIASSTGGTDALEKVFKTLPADCPPTLVVQHMPSGFTKLFAERLNNFYPMNIIEAQSNDYVRRGQILIAPADSHMALDRSGAKLIVKCFVGQKVHAVMPAADVLFESAGPILKSNAVGVVLTGMGSDGAKGLMQMHMLGARTICQDEATCVVYGMPKAAFDLGAADFKLPIGDIGKKIMELAR